MSIFAKLFAAILVDFSVMTGETQAEYPEKPVQFVVPWPPVIWRMC